MDVRIDISKKFENGLKKRSAVEQEQIKAKLNFLIELFREGKKTGGLLYRTQKIPLPKGMTSSLFVFMVNKDIRIILTSEKDPLFGEHILTLITLANPHELNSAFKGVAESLYHGMLNGKNIGNG